ncbi:membrane protein [Gordonia phage Rabbitrun]|uniref:Membrane protein n=1 Tax=Gordonia phage Rabbitrun TaxID=2762280 RepID=A0A7G8LIU0_9CAUD|nr:membrane protein [Gordonia phage Rabbitrun]QNJ57162.1 membrane protein [Gordonia phage Rabbitrun]
MSDYLWVGLAVAIAVFSALVIYGRHLEKHPERSVIGSQLIEQHGRTVETVTREAFRQGMEQERSLWATWLDDQPEPEPDDEPTDDDTDELDGDEPEPDDDTDDEPRPWTDLLDN